jgi:hypothetical protein
MAENEMRNRAHRRNGTKRGDSGPSGVSYAHVGKRFTQPAPGLSAVDKWAMDK